MSNHSLPALGTDPPFSLKIVVSIMHEQNIICSKTLICRQLFAGHVVSSRSVKRKEKIHGITKAVNSTGKSLKYNIFGKYGKNDNTAAIANKAKHKAMSTVKALIFTVYD